MHTISGGRDEFSSENSVDVEGPQVHHTSCCVDNLNAGYIIFEYSDSETLKGNLKLVLLTVTSSFPVSLVSGRALERP